MEQNRVRPGQDNLVNETRTFSPDGDNSGQGTTQCRDIEPVVGWIRRARNGEMDSMEQLISHYQNRVWKRALYRIGDPDEASEVTQEVFILCFRKLDQFRGDSMFWTWISRIVDNQVSNRRSWWRRRGSLVTYSLEPQTTGDDEDPPRYDPRDPSPSPRQEVEGRQLLDALNDALGRLSADHREILLLRFSDGLSYEEISESLQISLGTVKSRINRARGELRILMEGHI